jgi:hypothetical protein
MPDAVLAVEDPQGAVWPSIADERIHGGRRRANCVKEIERATFSKARKAMSAS